MSFSMKVIKAEDGTFSVETSHPDYCPNLISINGHVEGEQTVDLSARVDGLFASASRRDIKAF